VYEAMGGNIAKVLKADPDTRHIPVLMVEGLDRIAEVAAECGVDDYLYVPATGDEYLHKINCLIRP
jgi:CheY-like chemotaxis protein